HAVARAGMTASAPDTAGAAAVARAAQGRVAFGPRTAMPAGLGGVVAALDVATGMAAAPGASALSTMAAPGLSGMAARSRVSGLPGPGGSGVSATRLASGASAAALAATAFLPAAGAAPRVRIPASLGHLAWVDRTLLRAAGATSEAVASTPVIAGGRVHAPPMVVVSPPPAPAHPVSAVAPARPPISPPAAAPGRAPMFSDDARVSDEVFAAIARGSAAPGPATPAPVTLAEATFSGRRPSPVEGLARAPLPAAGAGLSAALSASPMAAALAPILGPRLGETVFDVRSLLPIADLPPASPAAPALHGHGPGDGAGAAMPMVAGWRPSVAAARGGHPPVIAPPADTARDRILPPAPAIAAAGTAAMPGPAGGAHGSHAAAGMPGAGWMPGAGEPHAAPGLTPVAPGPRAAAASSAITARAMVDRRPGAMGVAAESFAGIRAQRAADLALDFTPPALLVAAARLGLAPADAARAVRVAAAGPGRLAALAHSVELSLLRAVAAGASMTSAAATGSATPSAPPPRPSSPSLSPSAQPPLPGPESAVAEALSRPGRARGATLFPAQAARALGLDAAAAASLDHEGPGSSLERDALEIIAAWAVAGASATPAAMAPLPRTAARGASDPRAAAAGTALTALPPGWVWVAGAGHDPSQRRGSVFAPLIGRAARAARTATTVAAGPTGGRPSARHRAQAAWAVMPQILTGDAERATRAAAKAQSPSAPGLALAGGVRRAGAAMDSLVAPGSASRPGAPSAAMAEAAAAAITGGQDGAGAGAGAALPGWITEAAKKLLADTAGDGDLSLAELTLVTAAPAHQRAASPHGASTAPRGPAPGGEGDHAPRSGPAPAPELDLDALAQDVFDQVLRMLKLARQRNGDPWA
ncbi:MAG TPA: hypothetical protein VFG83_18770, partial [Kofleriaceae bacterium]|nr:hypothetical protein [Kofleriaceae bacterium]